MNIQTACHLNKLELCLLVDVDNELVLVVVVGDLVAGCLRFGERPHVREDFWVVPDFTEETCVGNLRDVDISSNAVNDASGFFRADVLHEVSIHENTNACLSVEQQVRVFDLSLASFPSERCLHLRSRPG